MITTSKQKTYMACCGVTELECYKDLVSTAWGRFPEREEPVEMLPTSAEGTLYQARFSSSAPAAWSASEIRLTPLPGSSITVGDCLQAVQKLCTSHTSLATVYNTLCESFQAWNVFAAPVPLRTGVTSTYAFVDITPLLTPCLVIDPSVCLNLGVQEPLPKDIRVDVAPLQCLFGGETLTINRVPVGIARRLHTSRATLTERGQVRFSVDLDFSGALLVYLPTSVPLPTAVTLTLELPGGIKWLVLRAEGDAVQPTEGHGFVLHLGAVGSAEEEGGVYSLSAPTTVEDRRRDWFTKRGILNGYRAETIVALLDFAAPLRDAPELSLFSFCVNQMRTVNNVQGFSFAV